MSQRRGLLMLLGALFLVCSPVGGAEKAPPRTDRHGDPLPAGALVRLGRCRLRVDEVVRAFAFWPDDQTLAACCEDGSIRRWRRASGRPRRPLNTGLAAVHMAAFIPGGGRIALVDGGQLLLWEAAAGKVLWKQPLPRAENRGLVASPDGKLLAFADCCAGEAHVYEVSSGRKLRSLKTPTDREMITLAFSADSSRLAAAAERKCPVRIWDVRTGKKVGDVAGPDYVSALAFAPDGKTLAAGGAQSAVLSDVATGKQRVALSFPRDAIPYDLTEDGLLFSADGKTLFSAHYPGAARCWDAATGKERFFRKGPRAQWTRLVLSGDGKVLVMADADSLQPGLRLLSPATGEDLLPVPEGHHLEVHFVAFTPDGRALLSGDTETVQWWNAATGKPEHSQEGLDCLSCALSSDRRLLAEMGAGDVRLWDLAVGKKLRDLKYGGKDVLRAVAFSPDGKRLLSLHNRYSPEGKEGKSEGQDGLRVWDVATGKQTESLLASTPDKELFAGLVVTPDGSTAVAGSIKGWVRGKAPALETETEDKGAGRLHRWDLRTGRPLPPLEKHGGAIRSLSLSADGKQLVSASADRTCRLWELASGQAVYRLPVPASSEQTAAISPDGKLLASSSGREDSPTADPFTIRIFSTVTSEPVLTLRGHSSIVRCLAFSPDGRRLASGLQDGTALVWDVAAAQQAVRDEVRRLAAQQIESLWADLASGNVVKARKAVWGLSGKGDAAVRLLKDHLKPATGVEPGRLRKLLQDLDDDDFMVREAASGELLQLGELAVPVLVEALKGHLSPEARLRARRLLAHISATELGPLQLRAVRSIEVLERVGSPEARQVLGCLATGRADARLTREAKAALDRLGPRSVP